MPYPIQQGAGQSLPDYDMEGYIKKYGKPDQSKGQHLTDEFKLPNHITFSTDSKYSTSEKPGGVWSRLPSGRWAYKPSDFVLQQHPEEELKNYFKKYEPNSELILRRDPSQLKESGINALINSRSPL